MVVFGTEEEVDACYEVARGPKELLVRQFDA